MDKKHLWVLNKFNGKTVYNIDDVPTIIDHIRGNVASGFILNEDFTLEPTYVVKSGDFFAHGKDIRSAQADVMKKVMSNMPIDERIDEFLSKYPARTSTGTGREFYEWHSILTGSCTQGRDNFCKNHDVKMESTYTVEYFINLVRDDYGRDSIKLLAERYNM